MLVVQICTAESGVASTCFVTALYWNKDRLLHQPQKKLPFPYNFKAKRVQTKAIKYLKGRGTGKLIFSSGFQNYISIDLGVFFPPPSIWQQTPLHL